LKIKWWWKRDEFLAWIEKNPETTTTSPVMGA